MTAALLLVVLVLALPVAGDAGVRRPPHYRMWMCIHRGEASWTDPNPPYFGGLQMGWWFMHTFGAGLLAAKGTADHWTPLEQMWVAERSLRGESLGSWVRSQWPQTGPPCL